MAHVTKIAALTDELVTLLTSTSPKDEASRFNVYRESALRKLRYGNYPRTNQFDIASRLEGLEEKFRVYNEDPLADALKERVDRIIKDSGKWTPEVLHLLLELSDKPVSKSSIADLDRLKEPKPDIGPPLKWRDIIAEDPLLWEKSVWRNVDFAADSSDEEDDELRDDRSGASDVTGSTHLSSVEEESSRRAEDHIIQAASDQGLEDLRKAQFWQHITYLESRPGTSITEQQAVREVLFMLRGSPTSLFDGDELPKKITPSKKYSLKHASIQAFQQITQDFADQGSSIAMLRSWTKQSQTIPLLQAFQHSLSERVRKLDDFLSEIEQRFVAPADDVVISLISIQVEIGTYLRPLQRLSGIVQRLSAEPYAHAFRSLELLYDETCTSQMAGDDENYRSLGEIFFECFQVYLRPIRTWMEEGELQSNDKVFFVSETQGDVALASIWESRFKLRKTQAGVLHAPKFLKAAANKIFTTGKSVVVLKHLNQFKSLQETRSRFEPTLDFDSVCNPTLLSLAPFPELFDIAFDSWIQSKHHFASITLRKTLFDSCGLHSSLDALSHLYFFSDGAASSFFTSSIFDKLDTLDRSWKDRFTVSSILQSTIGTHKSISASRVRTATLTIPRKYEDMNRCRRTVKTLACIELKYSLPWPILIITKASTLLYQKVFTFLFQIRRSSHILTRSRLVSDPLLKAGSTTERSLYYALRCRLLWFTQILYHYLTILVIAPNTEAMQSYLKRAQDVDSMIQVHSNYIKSVVDQALLGTKLELIRKTVLNILDLAIKLEDAHAANVAAQTAAEVERQERMNLSYASLGLTPSKRGQPRNFSRPNVQPDDSSSEDDDDAEIDVDLSIMSTGMEENEEISYAEKLRKMKAEFDRLVKFVASGLRGVARAGAAPENAKAWDVLGEMLESSTERQDGY
ncbi:gamma-tubulin complex component (Spc97/Spc98 family protein) [Phlyctema vagabunda]|uniref:Spindle pole body component n=1 Tax=Phlyctema vagabunda TaxID=108571 RepID=A0ABR4PHH5_9HELO